MRFDVYGRFVLVVERVRVEMGAPLPEAAVPDTSASEASGAVHWRVLQVGADGKRRIRDDIAIPDAMPDAEIAHYLDDVLHEYAHPGAKIRCLDPVMRGDSGIYVVGAAIVEGARCLIAQRGPGQKMAGKWEFPGGKVEPGEAPEQALVREIREELGLVIGVGPLLGTSSVVAESTTIVLEVYAATLRSGEVELLEHAQVSWVTADELATFDWAEADIPIVAAIADRLRGTGSNEV